MKHRTDQELINHFDGVIQTGENAWMALCPAHPDKNQSLSIKKLPDRWLLHDFAGCSIESILEARGLTMRDLFLDDPQEQPKKGYDYQDERGNLLFQVVRSPGKKFMQRRPDGQGGWINNIRGVRRVPYRLPELLAGIEAGAMIFIPEGEKDVENLRKLGLVATCNPMGAGKWTKDLNPHFRGANVVILPDNDEPGRKHAEKVAQNLQNVAESVKILELPGLEEKGDVSDWLEAGGTVEQLLTLAQQAPDWRIAALQKRLPKMMTGAEILSVDFPEPVWVIPGLIPAGLTVLTGAPKLGKSWLALCLAGALAHGGRALGKIQVEKCGVLYLALEDTPRRLQSRMEQLEMAPAENLHFFFEWERGELGGSLLYSYLAANRHIKAVFIDTFKYVRTVSKGNVNVYDKDYEDAIIFKRVADRLDIAVVLVHHDRKATGQDWLSNVGGSYGITGAADTIVQLTRSRGEADAQLNVTGRDVEQQELALEMDPRVGWTLLGDAKEYAQSKERQEILQLLAEASGPMKTGEIAAELDKTGPATSRLLKKLVKEGLVQRVKYGSYMYNSTGKSSQSSQSEQSSQSGKSSSSDEVLPELLPLYDEKSPASEDSLTTLTTLTEAEEIEL